MQQRPNLTKAPVGTTVVDNGMERTVHSQQTMAFPEGHQQRLETLAQQRIAQQTAPAKPGPDGRRPPVAMAIPTGPQGVTPQEAAAAAYPFQEANQQIPQGRVAARHAAMQAQQPQAPMTAEQHNMRQQPSMGHAASQVQPPQRPAAAHVAPPPIPQIPPRATFKAPDPMPEEPNAFDGVPTVENTHPGFTGEVADGEASSLDLPSRFWPYNFKDVYATPFVAYHLAKLSRAHDEGSLLPMVEAVSSVLQSSDPGMKGISIAHRLTVPDFYFVMYWLKLHSYTKGSYLHTTVCMNPEHHKWVQEGKKPRESLKVQELVQKSQLKVNALEVVPDMSQFNLGTMKDGTPLELYPATMADTLSFLEHPLAADPEFQWLARRASFVRVSDAEVSFNDRVEITKTLSADQIAIIEKFEKICDSYGVQERITVRCKECGASRVTKMTLDAHSFLSA